MVDLSGFGSLLNVSPLALHVVFLLIGGSVGGGSSSDSDSVLGPDFPWTNLPDTGSLP